MRRTKRRLDNLVTDPRRGTARHQTLELLELLRHFKKSTHDSSFSHIIRPNVECRMLYGVFVVILWTCYGAL